MSGQGLSAEEREAACGCFACIGDRPAYLEPGLSWLTVGMTRMIVCGTCGNKRCPHATDHRNACTGSNEPGQEGSRYGVPDLTTRGLTAQEFLDSLPDTEADQ